MAGKRSQRPVLDRMKTPDFRKQANDQFDVEIQLYGNKRLFAHKAVLSLWSEWFDEILNRNEDEDYETDEVQTVELKDCRLEVMKEFLAVIYPPNREITDKNVVLLLEVSHVLRSEEVKTKCEELLLKRRPCIELYHSSQHFELKALEEKCVEVLKKGTLRSLEREENWKMVDDAYKAELLEARMIFLEERYESTYKRELTKWTTKLEEVDRIFTDILNAWTYEDEGAETLREKVVDKATKAMEMLQDENCEVDRPYSGTYEEENVEDSQTNTQ